MTTKEEPRTPSEWWNYRCDMDTYYEHSEETAFKDCIRRAQEQARREAFLKCIEVVEREWNHKFELYSMKWEQGYKDACMTIFNETRALYFRRRNDCA